MCRRGCKKVPWARPPPIIQNKVSNTATQSTTLILPIASILRYNKATMLITTPPLISLVSMVFKGNTGKKNMPKNR